MILRTKCWKCGRSISVTIDDLYVPLGDPLSLICRATCNVCADLLTECTRLEDKFGRVCFTIGTLQNTENNRVRREELKANLVALCHRYARLHSGPNLTYPVDGAVGLMMEKPAEWKNTLWEMRSDIAGELVRTGQHPELTKARTPHAD